MQIILCFRNTTFNGQVIKWQWLTIESLHEAKIYFGSICSMAGLQEDAVPASLFRRMQVKFKHLRGPQELLFRSGQEKEELPIVT